MNRLRIRRTRSGKRAGLSREDLITILPRKGILVSETDPRKQLLVLEVWRELERLVSRLAAQRATQAHRERFGEIAASMDRAAKTNDDMMFMRLDRELNLLLAEAAQNDYASRAMRFLQGHSRRFWYLHYNRRRTCRFAHDCTPGRRGRSPPRMRSRGRGVGPSHRLCGDVHANDRDRLLKPPPPGAIAAAVIFTSSDEVA